MKAFAVAFAEALEELGVRQAFGVGDGAMLMFSEVSTAVATCAPAIWVVLNDSCYNMCAQGTQLLGLTNVDCSLSAALCVTGPVIVDVHIDPQVSAPVEGRTAGLLRDSAPAGTSPVDGTASRA